MKYLPARTQLHAPRVAPPRGERGLKFICGKGYAYALLRRSPSWGAWIEITFAARISIILPVAPPRGERGLKCLYRARAYSGQNVAPPRGERGLKFQVHAHVRRHAE